MSMSVVPPSRGSSLINGSGQVNRNDIIRLTQPPGNMIASGLGEHFRVDTHENSLFGQGQTFLVWHKLQRLADAVDHVLQRLWIGNEIEVVGVNRQQTLMPFWQIDESLIGFGKLLNVSTFHAAFVGAVAMGDAVQQGVGVGTQEDQQIGLGYLIRQGKVNFMINIELISAQVDAGKEGVFIKGVIRNKVPTCRQGAWNTWC